MDQDPLGYPLDITEPGQYSTLIRLIPQGTVDNNLGPDRLAGPKDQIPIIADNQPFDCMTIVWKT